MIKRMSSSLKQVLPAYVLLLIATVVSVVTMVFVVRMKKQLDGCCPEQKMDEVDMVVDEEGYVYRGQGLGDHTLNEGATW